jgi:hypothetical protein
MNRREFLSNLWPFGVAVIIPASVSPATFNTRITYGYMSVDDPIARYAKIYLNGEDVSGQSFEADDREGFVGIYEVDKHGRIVWPLIKRRIYGRVRIVMEK